MMHQMRMPIAMGTMLGLMTPWMMHGDGTAGVLFILSHVAIVAGLTLLTLFIPSLRQKLSRVTNHRPNVRHIAPLVATFAFGWAITCVFCVVVGGEHWT